ncbi:bifunctional fucokinase/L-fucose-1-P-guanylyltransferase [Legionella massiliensis]|uniref:Bifunctional fucokinase/L-fucose-1-P-guanylyltransferase n=1 Tax=Legionella massiliensis TaxID=1034943 RepID=A0A078KX33_9GAMM|nr:galactokinase [Legionella massiliensis]CDZ77597.1 bifunctional fucokinase/L-fucose-1-P-guanylyltransferase [Legionella massiliensis]CEE13335.1 D-glycero-alpha-D-manno-heptose 7-phosphate kinase [Legionella massiliensis]
MIIARSPLRISLGGGGTDLPSYYQQHEGFLIAAAINKYVYLNIMRPFSKGIFLKYSEMEHVDKVDEIKHRIIHETLKLLDANNTQIEISSLADIPAGTGLGSSGSFTTALLMAWHAYNHRLLLPQDLAELACHIEIDLLGEPIGKQDQYIAAFGGLTCFTFHKDNKVTAASLEISKDTLFDLEDNLLLFFTGYSRSAGSILGDQKQKTEKDDDQMLQNLHFIKELGLRKKDALEQGDMLRFGELMHEHWEYKKLRSKAMSSRQIDEWYELGMKNGAVGGKLVGAGGGGFLMFYAADRNKLRHTMRRAGLEEVRFAFDFDGTKIVLS